VTSRAVLVDAEPENPIGDKRIAEGATLVVGASGLLGRECVQALVERNCSVVAVGRSAQRIERALAHASEKKHELVAVRGGIDVTDTDSLDSDSLWEGVSQVILALGPVLVAQPDGSRSFEHGLSPKAVDFEGVRNVSSVANFRIRSPTDCRTSLYTVAPIDGDAMSLWKEMSDPIMGGSSSATWSPEAGGALWGGELVWEGGGFASTRLDGFSEDLSNFDGLYVVSSGSSGGERFKLSVKSEQLVSEQAYQQAFETTPVEDAEGKQISFLPWEAFVPVQMASVDDGIPELDTSNIVSLGLVLSKLEMEDLPNPTRPQGDFNVKLHSIGAYRSPRPKIITFSSCGVERNARIRTNEERQQSDLAIVQLNPSNILNWKLEGESAVRNDHSPLYTVIRMTGLTTQAEHAQGKLPLEVTQGDRIAGTVSRTEAARVAAVAVHTPGAAGKSVDVRREVEMQQKLQHLLQQQEQQDGDSHEKRLHEQFPRQSDDAIAWGLANCCNDVDRPKRGIKPLPKAQMEPDGALDEQQQKAVLQREDVNRSAQQGRGGRVRGEGA